jgi:gas vesicle protein
MDTQTTAPQTSADRADTVRQETKAATADVASTAGQEARRVAADTKHQVRRLVGQTREDLQQQAATQQSRAASSLRELADQLREMADGSDQDGVARGLVDDVARRAGDAASWLDTRSPGSLLDEARGFARRRPGAFLAIAAGVGVVAGRLSRSLIDEAREESDRSTGGSAATGQYAGAAAPVAADPMEMPSTMTSGAVAGGGTAGTAGGFGEVPPIATDGAGAGTGAATSGTASVPPTPGGSPLAPQTDPVHTGTSGTVSEDDETLRGPR